MTRYNLPILNRWLIMLSAMLMIPLAVSAQQKEVLKGDSSTNGVQLNGDRTYYVTDNVTYTAQESCNALVVSSGATVVIYIADGCTLTVNGGNAHNESSAGAGILVPENSKLILTGGGRLVAKGGRGGDGGHGGNGGPAYVSSSRTNGYGGQGGGGGAGGGGAAAGIGGRGGDGHGYLTGPQGETKDCEGNDFDSKGVAGYNTESGKSGTSMGTVYVLGTVKVQATPGGQGNAPGVCGEWGASDHSDGPFRKYLAGGGGPGGGGGSGYAAQEGIGGGAPGAQCGATGGSGGSDGGFQCDYYCGGAGAGGKGAADGQKKDGQAHYLGEPGGSQNASAIGSHGGKGTVYYMQGTSIEGRAQTTAITEAQIPTQVKHVITFNTQGGFSGESALTFYMGIKLPEITIPTRSGMFFCGYYTAAKGGQKIFDSLGRPCTLPDFCDNTTLFAQWVTSAAFNETTRERYSTIDEALEKCHPGDVVRLMQDVDHDLTISKAFSLILEGLSLKNVTVGNISGGTLTLKGGTMGVLNPGGLHSRYSGYVVLNNMQVDTVYADGHSVILDGGVITGGFLNEGETDSEAARLADCFIVSNKSYVRGGINSPDSLHFGRVVLQGGYFSRQPDEKRQVIIPSNFKISKTEHDLYPYVVEMRSDFNSYVSLNNEYVETSHKANDNTELTLHFTVAKMQKGLNAVVGSTDANPDKAHRGFALYVDGTRKRFVFAAGTDFEYSTDNVVQEGQDYYVTLRRGHFEVKTSANQNGDYYHKDIAIYQAQYSDKPICLGRVNGGSDYPCQILVHEFRLTEGKQKLLHLKPAHGFKNEDVTTDFCLYDVLANQVYYNDAGQPLSDGLIGLCASHPAYRIIGEGLTSTRQCVLCGLKSQLDPFVQSEGTLFTLAEADRKDATKYVLRWADIKGDQTEHIDVSTTMPVLKNMKFFKLELFKGDSLIASYVPRTCDKHYIYNSLNSLNYALVENTDAVGNVGFRNHHMTDVTTPYGEHDRMCSECGMSNSLLQFRGLLCWDAPVYIPGDTYAGFQPSPLTTDNNRKASAGVMKTWQSDDFETMHTWTPRTADGHELARFLPSKYGDRPGVYDAYSGVVYPLMFRDTRQELSAEHLETYSYIETCREHKYLSPDITEKDGETYRTCMICNELVKTEDHLSLQAGQYVMVDYDMKANSRVEVEYLVSATNSRTQDEIRTSQQESVEYPFYTSHTSSKQIHVYSQEHVGGEGFIKGITYNCKKVGSKPFSNYVEIWMGTLIDDNLRPVSAMTRVYAGRQVILQGDNTYQFPMPFWYDGHAPLQVVVIASNGETSADIRFSTVDADSDFKQYYLSNDNPKTIEQLREMPVSDLNTTKFRPETRFQRTDDGVAVKSSSLCHLGSTSDVGYVFGVNIYEGEDLVRHYVPARQASEVGLYETVEQKFYLKRNTKQDDKDQITTCQHHAYVTIKKSKDDFGFETWESVCRICGECSPIASAEPFVTTNGSEWFDTGYTLNNRTRATLNFEVNGVESHYARNAVFGATSAASGTPYFLDINTAQCTMTPNIGNTASELDDKAFDLATLYYVEMDADGAHLYQGTNVEGGALCHTWKAQGTVRNATSAMLIGSCNGMGSSPQQQVSNINVREMCIYEHSKLTHRYLPSLWQGEAQFYDAIEDKFIKAHGGQAQAYVPTCQFHRYFQMESEQKNGETVLYRHCKLCDARFAISGLKVQSEEDLRAYIYKEDKRYTMYLDMQHADGTLTDTLTHEYPKIVDSDLVFSLAVMDEGKLIGYHLPARRHVKEGEGYVYGMFNSVDAAFRPIKDAQVFITECSHPYFALYYANGDITKRCQVCDEMLTAPVGYYVDLSYNANDGGEQTTVLTQRITMLLDGTDTTDKTLQQNPFRYGYHFFGGWQQGKADAKPDAGAPVMQPGEEYLPSADRKGPQTIFAKWDHGFTVNGDTLKVNSDNTDDIRIVDDGYSIFGATTDFTAGQISYERLLPEDGRQWGTLCLPFAVTSDATVQYYSVSKTSADGKSLILDEVATTVAGQPYVFRMLKADAESLLVSSTHAQVKKDLHTTPGDNVSLVGSYDYMTFECNDKEKSYFAIAGDKFLKTDRQITVRPYHAHIEAGNGTPSSQQAMLLIALQSEVQQLDAITPDEVEASDFYDLNGRPVKNFDTPGIYIRRAKNGQRAVKVMTR